MFNEYPKCMYLAGSAEAAYAIVTDADTEKKAREDGYSAIGEPQEKAKRPYQRKDKDEP